MQPRPFDALGFDIVRAGNIALFQALARKLPGVKHIDKIASDTMSVIRDYPQLYAHTTTFFNEHGIEELRICLKGLVTTTFKGNSYQTPVTLWINSRYPDGPPEFYVDVSAAPGMIVAPGHPCVAKDGQVAHPHMQMWASSHTPHGLSPFVRTMIEIFNQHPPLRSSMMSSTPTARPTPLPAPAHPGSSYPPSQQLQNAGSIYIPGPVPQHLLPSNTQPNSIPAPMMPSHSSMRGTSAPVPPSRPLPPQPAVAWEQRHDPASGRPGSYYFNAATGQSVWVLPPGAIVAPPPPPLPPAEPPPPSVDTLVYNYLIDSFKPMMSDVDAAAEACSAKQQQLQSVLADSQKMQEYCSTYKQHIEQAIKYERECQLLLPQLEHDLKCLDTLVLPPAGSLILQKMSEELADAACTKALAVQGPVAQLHESKKISLEQYLRCVGAFAQRKFKAKYTLRMIRELEQKNTYAGM